MDRVQKATQMITEYAARVSCPDTPPSSLNMEFAQIALHLIREFDPPAMDPDTFRHETDIILREMPDDIGQVPVEYFPFVAFRTMIRFPFRPALETEITTDDGETIQPFHIFSKMYYDFVFDSTKTIKF